MEGEWNSKASSAERKTELAERDRERWRERERERELTKLRISVSVWTAGVWSKVS